MLGRRDGVSILVREKATPLFLHPHPLTPVARVAVSTPSSSVRSGVEKRRRSPEVEQKEKGERRGLPGGVGGMSAGEEEVRGDRMAEAEASMEGEGARDCCWGSSSAATRRSACSRRAYSSAPSLGTAGAGRRVSLVRLGDAVLIVVLVPLSLRRAARAAPAPHRHRGPTSPSYARR